MPKIERERLRKKIWNRLSNKLIDVAESLPNTKKGVLHWLQNVRSESAQITTNIVPAQLTLELQSIWISEFMPIEKFESSIPRVLDLIYEHKSKRFLVPFIGGERDKLEEELRSSKNRMSGFTWRNLGFLDVDEASPNGFVDSMSAQLISYDGDYIFLTFGISPKREIKNRIQQCISTEYSTRIEINPPHLKTIFRGWWGSRHSAGEVAKLEDIQREIRATKEFAVSYLHDYFDGHVFRKGFYVPSTELWIKSGSDQSNQVTEAPPFREFWDSVGMRRGSFEEYTEGSAQLSLYLPDSKLKDFSTKLLADEDKYEITTGFVNKKHRIVHEIEAWIAYFQTLWALQSWYLDTIQEISHIRIGMLPKIVNLRGKKFHTFFSPLFAKEITLDRLSKACNEDTIKHNLQFNGFPDFQNNTVLKSTLQLESHLLSLNKNRRDRALSLITSSQGFLKTALEVQNIRVNIKTQNRILWLTGMMLCLALVSAYVNKDIWNFGQGVLGTVVSFIRGILSSLW